MRKLIICACILATLGSSIEVQAFADRNGKIAKNGQYKRKKGFMWGLFKKKNACDCPKH